MRYKKYIIESEETNEDIIDMFHTDCSDYFKYIKYGVKSFRGFGRAIRDIYLRKRPRDNRRPSDIPKNVHDYLNNQLKKKFGWYPRSEGVFVTGNYHTAEEFNTPYYFYPSNGFKMVWNPNLSDIFVQMKDSNAFSQNFGRKGSYFETSDDYYKDLINEYIPYYKQGTAKDINKALQSGGEITFKCDYYYLVHTSFVTQHFDVIYNK